MQAITRGINIVGQGVLWLITIVCFGYGSMTLVSTGMVSNRTQFFTAIGMTIFFLIIAYLTMRINKKIYHPQNPKLGYQERNVGVSIAIILLTFFVLPELLNYTLYFFAPK